MDFSLTTLGTASAKPVDNRFSSAHVFNIRGRLFLVDCGEGTQIQLNRFRISMLKIDNIMISHMHGDHVFGIFGLLSSMGLYGRTAPIYIYAPRDFASLLKFYLAHFHQGSQFEINHIVLKGNEPVQIFDSKSVEVYSFPLNHGIETYGFLFKEKMPMLNIHKYKIETYGLTLAEIGALKRGENVNRKDGTVLTAEEFTYLPYTPRTAAYCSDTAPFEKLADWIRGVDLLYHEATYLIEEKDVSWQRYHSTANDAAKLAAEADVKRLVLGHFSSRYKDLQLFLKEARNVFPNCELSQDGMVFDVPMKL